MSYTPNEDVEFENAVRGNTVKKMVENTDKTGSLDHDFDDILRIFRTPEYQARQQAAREREARRASTPSFQNSHGRVSNINPDAFTRGSDEKKGGKKKFSLFKTGAIFITAVGCLVALHFGLSNNPEPAPVVVPDGYVAIMATEQVDYGDSVYSIATEYYKHDLYGTMYEDINDFVDEIIDVNDLSSSGKITPYDSLSIPVLVDVDNPCYQELKAIESEIAKIKEEAYWVDYVVQFGDSLSSIASKASGSYGETINLVNEILSKNKLSNSLIYQGQTLKIVNPALGPLKISFNEMQNALFESLKIEETQK